MTREGHTDAWAANGAPLCVLRCMQPAALTIDGEPHCIDCADLVIERDVAVSLNPALVDSLPPLTYGREAYEAFRRSHGPIDRRSLSGDSDQLRALHAEWEAAGSPGDAGRARERAELVARAATGARRRVTRVELHEQPSPEPAGQLSLLADGE